MSRPRVGFVINSRVPSTGSFRKGMPPHALVFGWDDSGSPMSFMRFHWVAQELRRQHRATYELFKPWRRYDAVVFLKSMGPHCVELVRRLKTRGTAVIFEANVDYYTHARGAVLFPEMVPTADQRRDATAMTEIADAVIASSRHLTGICSKLNARSVWIPDNINLRMLPDESMATPFREGRLQVWWSGMASKLCEFLATEDAFVRFRNHLHLNLVTSSLNVLSKWTDETRNRFQTLLSQIPHTIYQFRDIPHLLNHYATGGIIVSPRYLDVPYNLSHTEWKITLGMACGLPALASPVPSYRDVAERARAGALTLCPTAEVWSEALECVLSSPDKLRDRREAAEAVVRAHYSTPVVAQQHLDTIRAALPARV